MFTLFLLLLYFTQFITAEILDSNLGQITLTPGLRARFYQVEFDGTESSNDRRAYVGNKDYLTKGRYLGEVKHVTSLDTNYVKYTSPYIYGFHIDPSVDQFAIELRGYYKPATTASLRMTSTVYGSKGCTEKVEPSILSPYIKASNAVYLNQVASDQICYEDTTSKPQFATLYNEVQAGSTSGMAVTGGTYTPVFTANNYYPIRIVLLSRGSALLSFYYIRDGTDYISFSSRNLFSNDNEDYDALDDNVDTAFPGNCPQFTSTKSNSKRGLIFDDLQRLVKRDDCPASSTSELPTSSSEIVTSSSEIITSSSEIITSSSEIITSSSEIITSSSEIPTSSSEIITSSEVVTSSSEISTSSSEIVTSSSEIPISSSEIVTSSSEAVTSSEIITSSSEISTSSSEIISSSSEIPTSSSDTISSSEVITSSDTPASSSEIISSSDIVTSSEIITSSTEIITSSSEIFTSTTSDVVISSETVISSSEFIPSTTSETVVSSVTVTNPSERGSSSLTSEPISSITSSEFEPTQSSTSEFITSDTSDIPTSSHMIRTTTVTSDIPNSFITSEHTNSPSTNNAATDIVTSNVITTVTDGQTITKTCTVCESSKHITTHSEDTTTHSKNTAQQSTDNIVQPKTTTITYVTTKDGTPTTIMTVTSYPVSSNINEASQFPTVIQSSSITQTRSGTFVKPTASSFSTFEGQAITLTFKHIWFITLLLLV